LKLSWRAFQSSYFYPRSCELASVIIIAPTAAVADGLATAVMVIGLAGLQLIEGLSGCEAYVVTKDTVVLKTSGFQES
jgi:FAD:protein FMN transferase